jgi:predicted transcriptional regulator
MKGVAVSVRLDSKLKPLLDRVCRRLGRSRSDVVREALKRQLRLMEFERLRRQVMPFAEARGYLTDEDIFKEVS